MNYLLRGLGNGFGRTIGRIFAYLIIGVILYFLFQSLDIDIPSILRRYVFVICRELNTFYLL